MYELVKGPLRTVLYDEAAAKAYQNAGWLLVSSKVEKNIESKKIESKVLNGKENTTISKGDKRVAKGPRKTN